MALGASALAVLPRLRNKMGILDRFRKFLTPVSSNRGWYPIIREPYSGAWQQNQEWTVDCVLAHHAVYSCITLISNDIGKLRHKLVVSDSDGIWTETTNPAYTPVLRKPNRYQNHIQFKQWWITCKLIRGNCYALKQRDARRVVTGLYLLDPSRVQVLVSESGDIFYQLQTDNLTGIDNTGLTVPASEIIHDRMNCLFHPLVGVSPLFAAGCVANLGLKIERNSSRFFSNSSRPSGILTAPGSISDTTAKTLKDYFDANFTGDNSGKVAVVGDGLKYERLAITASDSQLIEQLKWTAEVICSTFHVPPYKIGVGNMPSYNNIEALQQDYYNTCLQSLIEEYETCMDEGLGLDDRTGVELDLDGLLRMDTAAQMETLVKGLSGGVIYTNEARKSLNKKSVEGGNVIFRQQQDYPLSILADRTGPDAIVAPAITSEPVEPTEPDDDELKALEHLVDALLTKELSQYEYR
ncbi:MAG: phage portal protein [Gallionella sp.]|jgi:HK97 family phage portal protein